MSKTIKDDKILFYENTKKNRTKKDKPISTVLKLANPITETANMIQALLSYDNRVITEFDFNKHTLWVYVSDPDVCDAYNFFLRREHTFGNLCLDVKLMSTYQGDIEEVDSPSYRITDDEKLRLFKKLFANGFNPEYKSVVDQFDTRWDFFEFPPIGISYQADDLQNINGIRTILLTDAIQDVFDTGFYKISSYSE